MTIHLGPREIGPHVPPLLIAEIGIGHCGDIQVAHDTIDACADAGLECVKFQCHIPDAEMVRDHPWYETVARCSFDEPQDAELKAHVEERGMVYLSTPFSLQAVERLERLGVVAYKIGSGENKWRPLADAIDRTGKPMLVSTGMARDLDGQMWVYGLDMKRTVLLHCVSKYPTPAEEWNLSELHMHARFQAKEWANGVFGLSDHSRSIAPAIAAVALGASVVEVHVRSVYGPRKHGGGAAQKYYPARGSPDIQVEHYLVDAAQINRLMHATWLGMQPSTPDESACARMCQRDAEGRRMAP